MKNGKPEYTGGMYVSGPVELASLAIAPAGTTVYMVVADSAGNLYRKNLAA
jgi:hypothetical protein